MNYQETRLEKLVRSYYHKGSDLVNKSPIPEEDTVGSYLHSNMPCQDLLENALGQHSSMETNSSFSQLANKRKTWTKLFTMDNSLMKIFQSEVITK